MKKMLALLLVAFMVGLNFVASAEAVFQGNFTIRSGINAGMTIEEVKSTEINNGNEELNEDVSQLYGDEVKLAFITELAGNGSMLFYWFDEEEQLKDFQYWIVDASTYSSFENSLTEKYGQPFMRDTQIPFNTRIMTLFDHSSVLNPKIRNYSSWLLWYDDCCVVVELMQFYSSRNGEVLNLNYSLVSHKEATNVLQGIKNEIDAAQQSAMNDL